MKILVTGGSGFIGTNFIATASAQGHVITDLSFSKPLNTRHQALWRPCDILDAQGIQSAFREFAPDAVVHLAARAECDEHTSVNAGYRANTDGTANVLTAVSRASTVKRLIITSSQYVCGPGRMPTSDDDYFPATVYGQSKVITEQLTHQSNPPCTWTIIRPTNVWGPWHMRYSREFWKIARKGLYVHPGGKPVIRSYAYVGTVVEQMLKILESPTYLIHQKTLYTTDAPDDIYHWADAFCRALKGKPAQKVPRSVLFGAALAGECISRVTQRPFYITWSRFQSMLTSYPTPYEETFRILGNPGFSLKQGVSQTVAWLKNEFPEFSDIP